MFAMTAKQSSISSSIYRAVSLILLTSITTLSVPAAAHEPSQFRPGIRNGQGASRLTENQLHEIAESLRIKTGFASLYFDAEGWMRIGGSSGRGSATAHNLILDAFQGNQLIELHRRERSSEIAFMRLVKSDIYESARTGSQYTVYHLEIDFSDFAYLNGDRVARAAFDLGFILMHELTHGIKQIYDTNASQSSAGDCSDYINHIRRELGMALRVNYFPEIRKQAGSGGHLYFARLSFTGGNKRYSVYWDAVKVGNIR